MQDPTARVDVERRLIQAAASRLTQAVRRYTQQSRSRMQELAAALNSLSPLAVLTRGYSLVRTVPDGKVVADAAAIRPGDRLRLTFARGEADARVEAVRE